MMGDPQGPASQPTRLCLDASLVLHLVLPAERDPATDRLWRDWTAQGVRPLGPALLYAEVTSVIRLHVATRRLSDEEGEAVFRAFNALGIQRVDRDDLHLRAWELAKRYQRPRVYDMIYLALAQLEDLELWTGDERLVNALAGHEPRVRWVPARPAPG
jgi:predicted nucleic acid-binding protein